jgi:uncharacterized delta-60 repeat protein
MLLSGLIALFPGGMAAAAELDPDFSGDGKDVITFPLPQQHTARAVVVQPDGSIVVGGDAAWADTGFDFTLVRYGSDGLLDSSFGVHGIARSHLPGNERALDLALQPDGKLVVAGNTSPSQHITLVRFNSDGTLDTSFGNGGVTGTNFGTFSFASAVAIRPDGKIVAGGAIAGSNTSFALVQLNPDGSLDSSFAIGGRQVLDLGAFEEVADVVLQPDGKVVLAGYIRYPGGHSDLLLARYQLNGSLDTSFGTGGIVTTSVRAIDQMYALALQPDGKLVGAGFTRESGGPRDYVLVRYATDGTLDSGFGTGGIVTGGTGGVFIEGHDLFIQPDGKIVVGGRSSGSRKDFALARHLGDGSLDPDFGNNGIAYDHFGYGRGGSLEGLALQPDGKIVATGWIVDSPSTRTFATARFLGPLPPGFLVTPTELETSEGGEPVTFEVVLTSPPTADVTIESIWMSDWGFGALSTESLTFTPGNWDAPQTVTVTPVDDQVAEWDTGYWIYLEPAVSADPAYDGLDPDDIAVYHSDDDTANLSVSSGSTTTEGGGQATIEITLSSQPVAALYITFESSDPTEGTVSPSELLIRPQDWYKTHSVTVTGVDDDIDDGDVQYTIHIEVQSNDGDYEGDPSPLLLTNIDDD